MEESIFHRYIFIFVVDWYLHKMCLFIICNLHNFGKTIQCEHYTIQFLDKTHLPTYLKHCLFY